MGKERSAPQALRKESRNNNFAFIRITAACAVFMGHMGVVLGVDSPYVAGIAMHELGVVMLFLMGGYLITKSWLADPHPLRYGVRRFFRLWPPLAVFVFLMVFVAGPLLSTRGAWNYFHRSSFDLYLKNLVFRPVYSQPGVFEALPEACSTNGSLWTMPVEAALYVLTPLLLTALRVRQDPGRSFYRTAALAGCAAAFDLYLRTCHPHASVVVYGTNLVSAFHLAAAYLVGVLFTYEEVKKYLNLQAAGAALCAMFLLQASGPFFRYLGMYLFLPYILFSFAFAPDPVFCGIDRHMDLSYGIYLYGFFFQQLVLSFLHRYELDMSYMQVLALSAAPTIIAAMLSYYLVERPMIRLGRRLVKRLGRGEEAAQNQDTGGKP